MITLMKMTISCGLENACADPKRLSRILIIVRRTEQNIKIYLEP